MKGLLTRTPWLPLLWLTLVWVLLWGNVSVANVLSGLVLASLVVVAFPLPRLRAGIVLRPWPFVVLVSRFFLDLVVASVQIAAVAFRPGPPPRGMVVDMHLRGDSELLQTLTAEMTALVPGSVVIDLEADSRRLTLHVFDASTREQAERTRRRVLAQEARVLRALDPDPQATLDPRRRRAAERRST